MTEAAQELNLGDLEWLGLRRAGQARQEKDAFCRALRQGADAWGACPSINPELAEQRPMRKLSRCDLHSVCPSRTYTRNPGYSGSSALRAWVISSASV